MADNTPVTSSTNYCHPHTGAQHNTAESAAGRLARKNLEKCRRIYLGFKDVTSLDTYTSEITAGKLVKVGWIPDTTGDDCTFTISSSGGFATVQFLTNGTNIDGRLVLFVEQ